MFIVCCRQSALTAVELADRLGIQAGKSIPVGTDIAINWGCSDHFLRDQTFQPERYINDPVHCANAIDKLKSLCIMRDAGIKTPALYPMPDRSDIFWEINQKKLSQLERVQANKLVARRRLHMDGSGFKTIACEGDLSEAIPQGYDYLMDFFASTHEYRVHVFKGAVIRSQYKKCTETEPNNNCRCSRYGWELAWMRSAEVPSSVTLEAKKAVNALKLDFGAVDVLWNSVSASCCVLEVNTAPYLTGAVLNGYIEAFTSLR
jgi:hypothetical protein